MMMKKLSLFVSIYLQVVIVSKYNRCLMYENLIRKMHDIRIEADTVTSWIGKYMPW